MIRVLLLGGTREATELAARLADWPGLEVISSLAGRTHRPVLPAGTTRLGGFGGVRGLSAYLRSESIDLLVDATHPFAAGIAANAAEAAALAGIPRLKLLRPPWSPEAGDRWIAASDTATAARILPPGARVLLAVGRQSLAAFAERTDVWFLVRLVDPPQAPLPLANADMLVQRGPFDPGAETALFRAQRITHVVCKNAGGEASMAKLTAARRLGLPVVIIDRPPPPAGERVSDVDGAVAWLKRHLGR